MTRSSAPEPVEVGPPSPEPLDDGRALRWAWRGALAFFVLAALTGAFFRFAVAQGALFGFDLGNVRHAHSHAMYFGWGTPALMALVARQLPRLGARPVRGAGAAIGVAFATALLAYPPFLFFGYSVAVVGEARLPLSMMAAGVNVIAWYAFAGLYLRARRGTPASLPLRLLDLSLVFLLLATGGAWGITLLQPLDVEAPALSAAFIHVFLDLFSEGWFVLGVLGLVAAEVGLAGRRAAWGVRLLAAGLPFTFALGMAPSLVPPLFAGLARGGGALVGVGTLLVVGELWVRAPRGLWRFALACLATKALAEVAVSVMPGTGWGSHPQLRILYLHLMLLGFVSVGLVAAARSEWGGAATRGRRAFAAAVAALLLSLVPLTPVWPAPWRGRWAFAAAALFALGPALVVLHMLASARTRGDAP